MPSKLIFAILVLLAGVMSSSGPARASLVGVSALITDGDFASEQAAVANFLGIGVTLLDRTGDALGTSPTLLNSSLDLTGDTGSWNTNPSTGVDALVIRAGTEFIILSYLGMPAQSGDWCTWGCKLDSNGKIVHMSLPGFLLPTLLAGGAGSESLQANLDSLAAYSVVPIPAALPLFLTALAALALIARRRKQVA